MSIVGAVQQGAVLNEESREAKLRRRLEKRQSKLISDRASWDAHIKEVASYILPRRARFQSSDTNQGTKRNDKILNGAATKALRTLGAGMHAGITSPARPWHLLSVAEPELAEKAGTKEWLHIVTERQRSIFARSNFYNALAQFYEDLGAYGTAVMWMDEDEEDVIRCHILPWGEYCLALDARGRPETLFRDVPMTVGQIEERGWLSKCSDKVKGMWERGSYDDQIDIVHVVEKRAVRDITKQDGKNMPYASYWYEKGSDPSIGFLKEWGYEECPFVAARWSVTGNDTYGSGPSFDALGDVKGLQSLESEAAKAAAMIVKPPMKGPSSMRGGPGGPSIIPGAMNYVDATSGGNTFEPAVRISESAIKVFDDKIARHEIRIKEIYYADLWLMLAQTDRREITAREVDERHEEKMLQLGPVLVRLHDELLDPAIDRTFAIMWRKGEIPMPPQELAGVEVRVEYVSILAQAQKLISSAAVERFLAMIGNMAAVRPDVLDRINWDEMVRHYGDILGIKPDLILPDDVVAEIRAARQRVEEEQAAIAQEQVQADTMHKLGKASTKDDTALRRLIDATGGTAPGAMA